MAVSASVFAARYKLACFYLANHLFETVIQTSTELDLKSVASLQRDSGFFMSSLRLVEQLTAFKSDLELANLQTRIEGSGTMYFKKSILTATVNQGKTQAPQSPSPNQYAEDDKPPENVYDKFIVKQLYDSYFSAYVADDEPLEFLDKQPGNSSDTTDLVSVFELGVFDTETLQTLSGILDFSSNVEALNVVKSLSDNPRYAVYKQFFGLVAKCV